MKTHNAYFTKIASIDSLTGVASLAALFLLLCFASGAWAQLPVTLSNSPLTPLNPVYVQGAHSPVEFHFGPGQTASIASVRTGSRLVIEHVNIQTWSAGPWFVELAGTGSGVYTNTAFMLNPVVFPGGRSFGVISSTDKMFANAGTTFQFNFSNSSVNNQATVPASVWVEVWGYVENNTTASDF